MNKTWIILKHEFVTTVLRRSFLLTLILVPVGAFVMAFVIGALNTGVDTQQSNNALVNELLAQPEKVAAEGYIDQSGILRTLPSYLEDKLLPYESEEAARQAIDDEEISAYYVIDSSYLETGKVRYVRVDYSPMEGLTENSLLQDALTYNLLNGDTELISRVQVPWVLDVEYTSPEPVRESDSYLTFFMPYVVCLVFYMVIIGASSLMLNSVTNEKQNRVIEILMTASTPMQLLTGKIIALGLAGLIQTVVWVGIGMAMMNLGGSALNIPATFRLEPSFLIWAVVFFILGYAVYASLMAGAGALVPNLREASQATTLVVLPMLVPLFLISVFSEDPNGTIATVVSLFPLTSPVAMMTRLSAGTVPLYQILIACALLVLTAWIIIRAVAGMFRAQNLLSGQPFKLKLFFKALIGRE